MEIYFRNNVAFGQSAALYINETPPHCVVSHTKYCVLYVTRKSGRAYIQCFQSLNTDGFSQFKAWSLHFPTFLENENHQKEENAEDCSDLKSQHFFIGFWIFIRPQTQPSIWKPPKDFHFARTFHTNLPSNFRTFFHSHPFLFKISSFSSHRIMPYHLYIE